MKYRRCESVHWLGFLKLFGNGDNHHDSMCLLHGIGSASWPAAYTTVQMCSSFANHPCDRSDDDLTNNESQPSARDTEAVLFLGVLLSSKGNANKAHVHAQRSCF